MPESPEAKQGRHVTGECIRPRRTGPPTVGCLPGGTGVPARLFPGYGAGVVATSMTRNGPCMFLSPCAQHAPQVLGGHAERRACRLKARPRRAGRAAAAPAASRLRRRPTRPPWDCSPGSPGRAPWTPGPRNGWECPPCGAGAGESGDRPAVEKNGRHHASSAGRRQADGTCSSCGPRLWGGAWVSRQDGGVHPGAGASPRRRKSMPRYRKLVHGVASGRREGSKSSPSGACWGDIRRHGSPAGTSRLPARPLPRGYPASWETAAPRIRSPKTCGPSPWRGTPRRPGNPLRSRNPSPPYSGRRKSCMSSPMPLSWRIPDEDEIMASLFPDGHGRFAWPAVVVGCRPEVAALVLGIGRAGGCGTATVQVQDPGPGVDASEFGLVVRQPQEAIRGPNVISSSMAIHGLVPADFEWARQDWAARLAVHPRPLRGVLLGGGDGFLRVDASDATSLAAALREREDVAGGTTVVLTSRRTPASLRDALRLELSGDGRFAWGDGQVDYLGLSLLRGRARRVRRFPVHAERGDGLGRRGVRMGLGGEDRVAPHGPAAPQAGRGPCGRHAARGPPSRPTVPTWTSFPPWPPTWHVGSWRARRRPPSPRRPSSPLRRAPACRIPRRPAGGRSQTPSRRDARRGSRPC